MRGTLDAAGDLHSPISYDPWGQVERGTAPTFGFTGELQQGDQVYLRARWYNAARGGFGSVDPFASNRDISMSLSSYIYGFDDPISNIDPTGKVVDDGSGGPNARDLTDWLYREMKHNLYDPRLLAIQKLNAEGNTFLQLAICLRDTVLMIRALKNYADAKQQFSDLVGDHKVWDFKHKIKEILGEGITLTSQDDIEYSVPGNIHFGYIARQAGYSPEIVLAGAGYAEITDPAHDSNSDLVKKGKVEYSEYKGDIDVRVYEGSGGSIAVVVFNLGDDHQDAYAVRFGIQLYNVYRHRLGYGDFREELSKSMYGFSKHEPRRSAVDSRVSSQWPYPLGFFTP